jgi:Eco57I restriction-modification methylase/TaqI-like C-terminal specificity domain
MAVAKLGVVYTPSSVAEQMVRLALEPLVAGKSPAEILNLRICDFAIGEGAFLVEIVNFLASAHGGRDAKLLVAQCVVGADIDPVAVATARATLEALTGATLDLRVGDALSLDWPRVDAVIGNPPYIRQEKLAPETKRALRTFASYDGVADLYVYFVELAHRLADRFCVIVPQKWLTAAYGRPLRTLLERESMINFTDVDPGAFPNHDAFPVIVTGQRTPAKPASGAPWHRDSQTDAEIICRWEQQFPALGDTLTPARGVVTGCNRAFVIDRATRQQILDEDRSCERLIRPLVKGRDIRPYKATTDRFILLMDRGCDLPDAIGRYLAPMRELLEPGSGRKPGRYKWYELQDPVGAHAKSATPRLFYQDIQTSPACCLDTSGLVPDTTVWTLSTDDEFLLALLNSALYAWYARRRFPPALNGAVRPKLDYMRRLPIAQPSSELRARIIANPALMPEAYGVSGSLIT